MTDETRNSESPDEEPQVYAVNKRSGGKWHFNRRDFVKAVGVAGAAGVLAGTLQSAQAQDGDPAAGARAHTDMIEAMVVNPNGTLLATGSHDQTIKLWSLPDGALVNTLEGHTDWVNSLAFSPDGTTLASSSRGNDKAIRLWSLPDGRLMQTLVIEEDRDGAGPLVFNADGTVLISGNSWGNNYSVIKLWSLPDGELLRTLPGVSNVTTALALSPDGTLLAAGGVRSIALLSLPDTELIQTFGSNSSSIRTLDFSPDGTLLVSRNHDNDIQVRALPEGNVVYTHRLPGFLNFGDPVAISPDASLLVLANETEPIQFLSLPEGNPIRTLSPRHSVYAVVISPDGSLLITAHGNGAIQLWSLPDGEYLGDLTDIAASLPEFEGAQYSPNDEGTGVITLPCGSPIPAGSTCICNCVAGSACSCVGYSGTGGSHYWYPN